MAASHTDPSVVAPEHQAPLWVYLAAIGLSVLFYAITVAFASNNQPVLAGITALAASYGLRIILRCGVDNRPVTEAFSPKTQSWAMLCDGLIAVAVGLATYARAHYLAPDAWFTRPWWALTAYAIGWAGTMAWQRLFDHPNIKKQGMPALIFDPAKIGHDWTTYSVLLSSVVLVVVPVLFSAAWSHSWIAYAAATILVTWLLAAVVHDGGLLPGSQPLDLNKLATVYNYVRRRPVPYYYPR